MPPESYSRTAREAIPFISWILYIFFGIISIPEISAIHGLSPFNSVAIFRDIPDRVTTPIVSASDFPAVQQYAATMEDGLAQIREAIRDERMVSVYPPAPTSLGDVVTSPGQFSMQIAVRAKTIVHANRTGPQASPVGIF